METSLVMSFALIGVLGLACQWIAWRLRLPAILFLLITGIIAGPGVHWLDPDALFGDMLFPLVSMAVAVILFEGSLTLKFTEIQGMENVVWRILTVGVLTSWVSISVFTGWLLDLDWHLALLFGSMVIVTGPTVIVPMLRSVRPTARITNILRWESILIDPLGALLAVLVVPIEGDASDGAMALRRAVAGLADPAVIRLEVPDGPAFPSGHPMHGKAAKDGRPTLYLCRHGACSAPVTDAADLEAALLQLMGRGTGAI